MNKERQASPKAWTESIISEIKGMYADFTVRDPGLREIEVDGQPATAMVADYTNSSSEKITIYGIATFGEKSAATLRMTTKADRFEELRKEFDTIVDSFKLE